jgi:hypothetical protein
VTGLGFYSSLGEQVFAELLGFGQIAGTGMGQGLLQGVACAAVSMFC